MLEFTFDALPVAIVSCDIVGHSSVSRAVQVHRVSELNQIISTFLESTQVDDLVWASGGDGGHLVFCHKDWRNQAIEVVDRLIGWERESDFSLRIAAHFGEVARTRGADGRVQAVGEAINTAAWILRVATKSGVVVSEEFRAAISESNLSRAIKFHHSRSLLDKSGRRRSLMLMSSSTWQSRWSATVEDDRAKVNQALLEKDGWMALYFIKRTLQVNSSDSISTEGLRKASLMLLYKNRETGFSLNPFLGHLDPLRLREVLQAAQLVERHYNEAICRYGDRGNTMFVILFGEIGVYNSEGQGSEEPSEPFAVLGKGDIVGELAYALNRNRTADLIALSEVALLSFNEEEVQSRLSSGRHGTMAKEQIAKFIESRVLEHIANNTSYLLGIDKGGPLTAGEGSWHDALDIIREHARLHRVRSQERTVNFQHQHESESSGLGPGIYILASGSVRIGSRVLCAESFPLLWVNMPGIAVLPERSYEIEVDPVKMLHIAPEGLSRLEPAKRESVYEALRRASSSCYEYDAFFSYTSQDLDLVARWAEEFRRRGLVIYVDEFRRGENFPLRLSEKILESRAMVAFISEHVTVRLDEKNWVLKEIRFYVDYFEGRARVFPVRLPGGEVKQVAPGFSPVDVYGDEKVAMNIVIDELLSLRNGLTNVPFTLRAKKMNELE